MTINNIARKWDLQQHRIITIATDQDRKDSDSSTQEPCQIDGGTISTFPEETGYANGNVFGELYLEQKWKTISHIII